MTAGEFRAWMDGFLIGRDKLSKADVEMIRKKAESVYEVAQPIYRWYPPLYPYTYPYVTYTGGVGVDTRSGSATVSSTLLDGINPNATTVWA